MAISEQIVYLLIIDLKIRTFESVFGILSSCWVFPLLIDCLEQVFEGSLKDASILPFVSVALYGVSLSGSCLTIGKDAPVYTLKAILSNWQSNFVEELFLLNRWVSNEIKAIFFLLGLLILEVRPSPLRLDRDELAVFVNLKRYIIELAMLILIEGSYPDADFDVVVTLEFDRHVR